MVGGYSVLIPPFLKTKTEYPPTTVLLSFGLLFDGAFRTPQRHAAHATSSTRIIPTSIDCWTSQSGEPSPPPTPPPPSVKHLQTHRLPLILKACITQNLLTLSISLSSLCSLRRLLLHSPVAIATCVCRCSLCPSPVPIFPPRVRARCSL